MATLSFQRCAYYSETSAQIRAVPERGTRATIVSGVISSGHTAMGAYIEPRKLAARLFKGSWRLFRALASYASSNASEGSRPVVLR